MRGRIGIIYNPPLVQDHDFWQASADVLVQVDAVHEALAKLGHTVIRLPFTADLGEFLRCLKESGVTAAFNLCESVDEDPQRAGHPAAVLELLSLPFTGSSAFSLMLTTDKVVSKRLLAACGINTPAFCIYEGEDLRLPINLRYPVIIKPRFEDASIGIDQESVCLDDAALGQRLKEFHHRHGSLLVEEFIKGRELNVSLFGYPEPYVLDPAEIDFSDFPAELYPIVGYKAKWDPDSFEYHHTPRKFLTHLPKPLLAEIKAVSLQCFRLFMLRDYARIDIRLDELGTVYVLEVNANPCLSPDAGFFAALANNGIEYTAMVKKFLTFLEQRLTG